MLHEKKSMDEKSKGADAAITKWEKEIATYNKKIDNGETMKNKGKTSRTTNHNQTQ